MIPSVFEPKVEKVDTFVFWQKREKRQVFMNFEEKVEMIRNKFVLILTKLVWHLRAKREIVQKFEKWHFCLCFFFHSLNHWLKAVFDEKTQKSAKWNWPFLADFEAYGWPPFVFWHLCYFKEKWKVLKNELWIIELWCHHRRELSCWLWSLLNDLVHVFLPGMFHLFVFLKCLCHAFPKLLLRK